MTTVIFQRLFYLHNKTDFPFIFNSSLLTQYHFMTNWEKRFAPLQAGHGIVLELIDERHAEPTFEVIKNNRAHLSQWLPWVGNMQTVDDFKAYIRRCKHQHHEGTDYGYMILQNKTVVGRIGIHYIHLHNRHGAIGYWLGKAFEGRGIITRSCEALLQHCFTTLRLNRIEIKCGTGNQKSAAVPERLGFTREGVLRQAEWVNGSFLDLYLYSLLKEEWERKRRAAIRQ